MWTTVKTWLALGVLLTSFGSVWANSASMEVMINVRVEPQGEWAPVEPDPITQGLDIDALADAEAQAGREGRLQAYANAEALVAWTWSCGSQTGFKHVAAEHLTATDAGQDSMIVGQRANVLTWLDEQADQGRTGGQDNRELMLTLSWL